MPFLPVDPPESISRVSLERSAMRMKGKLLLGLIGGGAALWATRSLLRSRRKIDLRGRVVVITGASSGLGLLVARMAAEQGAALAIAARDESDLNAAATELRGVGSPDVLVVPTDVADQEQAERLIARTIEHFGRIDVLINNAATMLVGPVESLKVDDFRRAMATNFWGEFYPTFAAIPHMQRQRFGRICNVVSIGGKVAAPHMLPYTVSKFALTGLSEGLRGEPVKDNIYVTAIYPGTIRTGGHPHVEIKGDHEAEYSWFALSDTIPSLSSSAHRCASALWDTVIHGDHEVVFGLQAKLTVGFHNLFPGWYAELGPLINIMLPKPPGGLNEVLRGGDVRGTIPDMVNRIVPSGTRPNPA
jgi:NAD(P)-dependent dehydrogenase (short-subunit alcohol dehydrogenase family)